MMHGICTHCGEFIADGEDHDTPDGSTEICLESRDPYTVTVSRYGGLLVCFKCGRAHDPATGQPIFAPAPDSRPLFWLGDQWGDVPLSVSQKPKEDDDSVDPDPQQPSL